MPNGIKTFEIDNLEMISVEASENSFQFALTQEPDLRHLAIIFLGLFFCIFP